MADSSPESPPTGTEEPPRIPPPLALAPARRARAEGAYLPLPLWARFALVGVIAVAALAALVLYVSHHNTDSPPSSNPAASVAANREAEILVSQDQTPHSGHIPAGLTPPVAMTAAVRADLERRITTGNIDGPLQRLRCHGLTTTSSTRLAFSCTALAASVGYQFLGVVNRSTHEITYCKRDPPPAPSDNVPVSPRCRA